jgi:hypothetical protein
VYPSSISKGVRRLLREVVVRGFVGRAGLAKDGDVGVGVGAGKADFGPVVVEPRAEAGSVLEVVDRDVERAVSRSSLSESWMGG